MTTLKILCLKLKKDFNVKSVENKVVKIANAKKTTASVKEIGVKYIVIGIILRVPNTLTITGNKHPKIISMDCLEKNPAFLIENISKYISPKKIIT